MWKPDQVFCGFPNLPLVCLLGCKIHPLNRSGVTGFLGRMAQSELHYKVMTCLQCQKKGPEERKLGTVWRGMEVVGTKLRAVGVREGRPE